MEIQTEIAHFENDLAEEVRLFGLSDVCVSHQVQRSAGGATTHRVTVQCGAQSAENTQPGAPAGISDALEIKRLDKRAAKLACYLSLCALTGQTQPWGSLTGVRPTKLLRELQRSGQEELFTELYRVEPHKAELARTILQVQRQAMRGIDENAVCLYVCVPFCVTRCSYCSFPGRIAKKGEMEAYVPALVQEIACAAETIAARGVPVCAIYVGGGTPTSLPFPLFQTVLSALRQHFPQQVEFTLEAGRPDTIDADKLRLARDLGVTRLCVNPQTMVDETLRRIGRAHTAQQVMETVALARSLGFEKINMDLIAGLPGEGEREFAHTLDKVRQIAPSSLTCHTLCIKRGSRLRDMQHQLCEGEVVSAMVERARDLAGELGLRPYYMYRQKYMAGNLENVGYARPGNACIYNIAMMDELRDVMALGMGAVGKYMEGGLIVRKANPKDLALYLARLPQILQNQRAFFSVDNRKMPVYNDQNGDDEEE